MRCKCGNVIYCVNDTIFQMRNLRNREVDVNLATNVHHMSDTVFGTRWNDLLKVSWSMRGRSGIKSWVCCLQMSRRVLSKTFPFQKWRLIWGLVIVRVAAEFTNGISRWLSLLEFCASLIALVLLYNRNFQYNWWYPDFFSSFRNFLL